MNNRIWIVLIFSGLTLLECLLEINYSLVHRRPDEGQGFGLDVEHGRGVVRDV